MPARPPAAWKAPGSRRASSRGQHPAPRRIPSARPHLLLEESKGGGGPPVAELQPDAFHLLRTKLSRPGAGFWAAASRSASRRRAGVIGAERMRTPVALYTALAMAGATGMIGGSPAPLVPILLAGETAP